MLQSTGDLSLFESRLVDELYSLYKLEDYMLQGMDENWADYRATMTDFTKSYGVDVDFSMMTTGAISDTIWLKADKYKLATEFNAVTIAKQNYMRVCLYITNLLDPIESLIQKLENQSS